MQLSTLVASGSPGAPGGRKVCGVGGSDSGAGGGLVLHQALC